MSVFFGIGCLHLACGLGYPMKKVAVWYGYLSCQHKFHTYTHIGIRHWI